MRVTNAIVTRSLSRRLLDNQRLLAEAQERVATGKRVQKMSDDPTAGSAIMQASGSLRGIEQYTRNVDHLATRLDAEDSALGQLTDLMTRARELGVATVGGNVDAAGRRAAGAELRQLLTQVVNIANTKIGDDYLFGGTGNDGRAPFTLPTRQSDGTTTFVPLDPAANPADPAVPRIPTGERQYEIAAGQTMAGPHAGGKVFLDSGMLDALDRLATAMESDQPADMGVAMRDLDDAFTDTQALVGEIGARQNQSDIVRAGLAALKDTFTAQKSGLSEVEMEQAITEMVQRQTAYQAAMLASSKVMGLSLADYLR
jgi:flagellar hook-associated protein 3 FlgL